MLYPVEGNSGYLLKSTSRSWVDQVASPVVLAWPIANSHCASYSYYWHVGLMVSGEKSSCSYGAARPKQTENLG